MGIVVRNDKRSRQTSHVDVVSKNHDYHLNFRTCMKCAVRSPVVGAPLFSSSIAFLAAIVSAACVLLLFAQSELVAHETLSILEQLAFSSEDERLVLVLGC